MPLTVTFDLEDCTGRNEPTGRWVAASHRFLDALGERGIRATVFIVGDAAAGCEALIRRVAADGHEIAVHGLHHVTLATSGPGRLKDELTEARALLQDLSGQSVDGFRAPIFSLTPATAWAVDAIAEAGFAYSSSILPAHNPLHGWPGLPDTPFTWDNGVVEFPCPVLGVRNASIPFLGGIYMRYVPTAVARRRLAALGDEHVPWSYLHPYDVDPGAPIERFPHANWPTSLLLYTRRRATMRSLDARIAAGGGLGAPLGERLGAAAAAHVQRPAA